MRQFFRDGRGLPQGQSRVRPLAEDKVIQVSRINLVDTVSSKVQQEFVRELHGILYQEVRGKVLVVV